MERIKSRQQKSKRGKERILSLAQESQDEDKEDEGIADVFWTIMGMKMMYLFDVNSAQIILKWLLCSGSTDYTFFFCLMKQVIPRLCVINLASAAALLIGFSTACQLFLSCENIIKIFEQVVNCWIFFFF